ncbi:hypothetical protein MA16_Dca009069 [Dendrobium catenatum]|uniref:Uncharacterized protein n=1 Tax=Dendrobium catenatum TaxID=906689 RepID=A0A2I0VRF8_9ASPA|nr:hypothetical protein MA16_Dca009069 [Dendrobium catenatum]
MVHKYISNDVFTDPSSPPTISLPSTSPQLSGLLSLQSFLPLKPPTFCTLDAFDDHLVFFGGSEMLTCSEAVYAHNFLFATSSGGRPILGPNRSFFAYTTSPSN